MAPSSFNVTRLRFRGWELRPVERVVLVAGVPVAIGSRAFDVLLSLVERRGEVVSKAALLDSAWPGLVVEENNISVQIAALRKALGPGAITTVPGIGYRLTAIDDEASPSAVPDGAAVADPQNAALARATMTATADLVGRGADVASLLAQVGAVSLISVIGTGGIGKTTLARTVLTLRKAMSNEDFHWIDLAPVSDGQQLVPLIAKTLGIELDGFAHASEEFFAALSRMHALIALDNCEHLIVDVAALVAEARLQAPCIAWLATSQVPLHVPGEVVYRLRPLGLPHRDIGLDEAMTFGAMELLTRRAMAADRHFTLHAGNLGVAIDLCRQLDGLPLAIEMAAARIANLGLDRVHDQLGDRLRLPAAPRGGPARQHTLRSTFDWSFGLLSSAEQTAFLRLQPFLGGVRGDMARHAMSDPAAPMLDEWAASDLIGALVDKSLVHRDAEMPNRFFLFESARDYARECLEERGELATVARAHAEVVTRWVSAAEDDSARLRDADWIARYVPERHNVRAALTWACEAREPDALAGLVTALALIDAFAQAQAEIVRCDVPMDVLLRASPPLRANACLEFSWAHYMDGSREVGTELAQRALDDFRAIGDSVGVYRSLAQLIRLYESRPDRLDEARQAWASLQLIDDREVPLRARLSCSISAGFRYEGSFTIARLEELEAMALRAGFDALVAVCRVQISDCLLVERRFDDAVETARQFLGDPRLSPRPRGLILGNQVLALIQLGREAEARAAARSALRALPSAAYVLIDTFALAAARGGRFVDAALMTGFGAKARRDRDESPDPAEALAIEETLALLRMSLAPEHLAELMGVGAGMPSGDVLDIALAG